MEQIADFLSGAINFVGDSPFRLLAVGCIIVAIIIFLFFYKEHPNYRVFATIMLVAGLVGLAVFQVPASPIQPTPTDGADPVQSDPTCQFETVQEYIDLILNAGIQPDAPICQRDRERLFTRCVARNSGTTAGGDDTGASNCCQHLDSTEDAALFNAQCI